MPDTLVFIPAWNEDESPMLAFPENRGLRAGIAEGYRRADECDVAIGSRFLPGSGEDGER